MYLSSYLVVNNFDKTVSICILVGILRSMWIFLPKTVENITKYKTHQNIQKYSILTGCGL